MKESVRGACSCTISQIYLQIVFVCLFATYFVAAWDICVMYLVSDPGLSFVS